MLQLLIELAYFLFSIFAVTILVDFTILNLKKMYMNGSERVSCTTSERIITIQGTTFYSLVEISSIIANPSIALNTEKTNRKKPRQKSATKLNKSTKLKKFLEIEGSLKVEANQQILQLEQKNFQLEQQVSQLNQLVVDLISGKPLFLLPPSEDPASQPEPETCFPRPQVNCLSPKASVTTSQCTTSSQPHSLTTVNLLDIEPKELSNTDNAFEQTNVSEAIFNIDQDMLDINLDEFFAELSGV